MAPPKKKNDQNREIKKLEAANKNLRFLHEISQKISEKKPLPVLLNAIMESSKLLMQAEASSLLLYDRTDDQLHFLVATGDKGELIKQFSMKPGEGIAGWVAQKKESLIIEDCYQDPRFSPDFDRKSNFRTRSMICVPLMRHDELLGVIEVINKKDGGTFNEEDRSLFEILAAQCAIAIENHRLTEKQIEDEGLELNPATKQEIDDIKAVPNPYVVGIYSRICFRSHFPVFRIWRLRLPLYLQNRSEEIITTSFESMRTRRFFSSPMLPERACPLLLLSRSSMPVFTVI